MFPSVWCFGTGMSCVDGCTHSRVVYIIQYLNVHPLWAQPLHCAGPSLLSHPTAVTFHPAISHLAKFYITPTLNMTIKRQLMVLSFHKTLHRIKVKRWYIEFAFLALAGAQEMIEVCLSVRLKPVLGVIPEILRLLHYKVSNNRRTKV